MGRPAYPVGTVRSCPDGRTRTKLEGGGWSYSRKARKPGPAAMGYRIVSFRLTPSEWQALEIAAADVGHRSVAEHVRRLVQAAI